MQEYMHDYTLDSAVQQWLLELLKMYIEVRLQPTKEQRKYSIG